MASKAAGKPLVVSASVAMGRAADVSSFALTAHSSRSEAHGDAPFGQVLLDLADAASAEVEDARRQHRVGLALHNSLVHMLRVAGTAGGDDRHRDRLGDGTGE